MKYNYMQFYNSNGDELLGGTDAMIQSTSYRAYKNPYIALKTAFSVYKSIKGLLNQKVAKIVVYKGNDEKSGILNEMLVD